jgi:hypothetical protein
MTDTSLGPDPDTTDEAPEKPKSLLPYAIWFGVAMALILTFLTLV